MEHEEVREASGPASVAAAAAPAGWYPDPSGSQSQRYWDGSQWTTHLFPAEAHMQTTAMLHTFNASPQAGVASSVSYPKLSKYPTFLIAVILWGVAAVWGLATPFIVNAVQMAQSRALFDAQVGAMTAEEQFMGQVLGRANDSLTSWVTGPIYAVWIFLGFIGLLGYALVLFFLFRGSAGARIAATVLSGLSVLITLTAGVVSIVHVLLNIAAAILIWMVGSTRFLQQARNYLLARKSQAMRGLRP